MKPIVLVPVCIVTSLAAAWTFTELRRDPVGASAATKATSVAPSEASALAKLVEELRKNQADLQSSLERLRVDLSARSDSGRTNLGDVDAAVERALTARGQAASATPTEPTAAAVKKPTVKDFLARLSVDDLTQDQALAIWKEATEAGLVDELVGLYEQRAKDMPNDPDAQLGLGQAYLQKLFTVGQGPESGVWAMKADKAFDSALELDDHHWDARFSKAMSLSFWPPVFGKQGEAIKHFETLVSQQEGQTSKPSFAQVHLLLGNMYQQTGQKDKALAAWQKGLSLFPGNTQLAQQIQTLQGN